MCCAFKREAPPDAITLECRLNACRGLRASSARVEKTHSSKMAIASSTQHTTHHAAADAHPPAFQKESNNNNNNKKQRNKTNKTNTPHGVGVAAVHVRAHAAAVAPAPHRRVAAAREHVAVGRDGEREHGALVALERAHALAGAPDLERPRFRVLFAS